MRARQLSESENHSISLPVQLEVAQAQQRIRRRSPHRARSEHRIVDTTVLVERRISRKTCVSRGFQIRTFRNAPLSPQLVEQRLRIFQIGGVEALGKPVVDVGEHRARLVATALLGE
jgi:hypothetical protein